MKNLKRLSTAVVLTFVFSLCAFAGDMNSPPCAPPDPGITETPPCGTAPIAPGDSAAPADTLTQPASNIIDIIEVVDAAMNLLLLF